MYRNINDLLESMHFASDSILVLVDSIGLNLYVAERIFDSIHRYAHHGTLVVVGKPMEKQKSALSLEDQRLMTGGPLGKLFNMREQVSYLKHPRLNVAVSGRYSSYFQRHDTLDFPNGQDSFFNDLMELNALILFFDESIDASWIEVIGEGAIIKDSVILDGQEVDFLHLASEENFKIANHEKTRFTEIEAGVFAYAVRYKDLF